MSRCQLSAAIFFTSLRDTSRNVRLCIVRLPGVACRRTIYWSAVVSLFNRATSNWLARLRWRAPGCVSDFVTGSRTFSVTIRLRLLLEAAHSIAPFLAPLDHDRFLRHRQSVVTSFVCPKYQVESKNEKQFYFILLLFNHSKIFLSNATVSRWIIIITRIGQDDNTLPTKITIYSSSRCTLHLIKTIRTLILIVAIYTGLHTLRYQFAAINNIKILRLKKYDNLTYLFFLTFGHLQSRSAVRT